MCLAFSARKQFRFIQHDHNVLVVKVSVPAMELVSGGMFVVTYATLKDDPVYNVLVVKVSVPAMELVSGGMFVVTYATLKDDPVLATVDRLLPGSRKVPKKLWEM